MRKRAKAVDSHKPGIGGGHFSAFGRHAPDPLSIPKAGDGIPFKVTADRYGTRWATIALLWLEAGYLTDADEGTPLELIVTAVKRWMEKQLEGVKLLGNFGISVMPYPSDDGFSPGAHYGYEQDEWKDKWFFGVVGGYDCPWFSMEQRVTALEAAHPGLGQAAVTAFQWAVARLLDTMTPSRALDMASNTWWHGTTDQKDYEQECAVWDEEMGGGDDEDDESASEHEADDDEDDRIGPDAFKSKFPAWMFSADHRTTLTDEALQVIAANSDADDARQVASLTLALRARHETEYRLPWVWGEGPLQCEPAYQLAYIRWNEADDIVALIDDHMNNANQCSDSFTEFLGADCVPLDQGGFNQWKTEIEAGFAVLKQVDTLLPLIADPDNS